ncbi:DUF1559 domain-containing protein, partial [Gemmata sp. JC717]|uniref:DUF1559 domain-containing protein n=1 Tax=Gemmata algarum TaxID=2975278 RepID=UPI0021BA5709
PPRGGPPPPPPPPPPPLPVELSYVPHDAALFLYVDAARVLSHEAVKGIRAADRKGVLGAIEAAAPQQFGMSVDDLKSVVVFVPRLTGPQDSEKVGFVVTFTKPFDKKKFEAGLPALLPNGVKFSVSALNDKAALVLQNFGTKDPKPRPADEDGPLTGAIKAAASGKHALVAGLTFANLPDELRKDNLPGPFRVAKPIFASDALVATVNLGQSLDLAVTVKAMRAAQAADAEKALAAITKLLTEELTRSLVTLEKDTAIEDGVTVLKALLASMKGGKFERDGTDARVTATLPLQGLPLAAAYTDAVKGAQQVAVRNRSANNLKQIGLALHNYHDTHGHFPPAAVCDKKGKPQLSWRVLILPYIEEEKLYKEFKLDEPWDGPNNKKLLAKMPRVYALPEATKAGGTDTYYRAFVGNGAAFNWLTGTQITGFADGTSNTVLCATGATAVPWTKPDELEFDPEKDPTKLFGLVVNGTAQVTMCDGSVRTLAKLPSKETLKALITRSGGEVIGNDF